MANYVCQICGYMYDSDEGDESNDIPPYTEFSDLPEDWLCPECGADKEDFEEDEEE